MSISGPSILQCPSCGASLLIEDEPTITCQYCGNRVLVPPEYRTKRSIKPQSAQTRTTTDDSEQPAQAPILTPTIPTNTNRASLIVLLAVGALACLGVFFFVALGGEDSTTTRDSSNASSTGVVSNNQQAQAPVAPALPTFTPMAELLLKFGEEGSAQGQFDDPRFIAVDPQGNLFVGDYSGGRVQKFDPQGNFLLQINLLAPDSGNEIYTRGIGVDGQGRLYAARNGDILVYDSLDGSLLYTIPSGWPDIYYDSMLIANNFLYSTNGMAGTDDILKLSPQGEILFHQQDVIESIDHDDPALNMQMAVDSQGQIYILSSFGPHVYVYDAQGEYLYRFGEEGNGRGKVDLSSNLIAIDPRGRLYVASTYHIDPFDTQGNYLDYSIDVYDDSDNGVPMGMTFDTQGFLYITCNNGRILKYQINSP